MFILASAMESSSLGWTILLIATASGWLVNGILLCRLTRHPSPHLSASPKPFTPQLDDGFLILDLKEMENLLSKARASREAMRASHEELQQLIVEDALTGCRNRRALGQQTPDVWKQHHENDSSLACLMLDIDHFKRVNDDHGHACGDEVLRCVGQTLRSTFAGVGQVYRYGGEEFCVILPGHDLAEARWIAERVRMRVAEIEVTSESTQDLIPVSVSIGATDTRQGAESFEAMIAQADECLYLAKRHGRNRVVAYNEAAALSQEFS